MTNIKKSGIEPQLEGATSTSLPQLVLPISAREAIGQFDDPREHDGPQPVRGLARTHSELRKATRYQFDSAAVIRWLGSDEQIHQAFGIVRDISTNGVFIETAAPLCLTANVELEIAPPTLQPYSSSPDLRFEGKIVRAVDHKGRQGFAIAGSLYISRLTDLDDFSLGS